MQKASNFAEALKLAREVFFGSRDRDLKQFEVFSWIKITAIRPVEYHCRMFFGNCSLLPSFRFYRLTRDFHHFHLKILSRIQIQNLSLKFRLYVISRFSRYNLSYLEV